jgi:hypothetical protein
MGIETVVVNVDATPSTAVTTEVSTEATTATTEATTQTTGGDISMGIETVVVNVDATPSTGGTTTETSTGSSTETTETTTQTSGAVMSMGIETVVVDVDATPTTGGTTSETSTESATSTKATSTENTTAAESTVESTTEQTTTAEPSSTETTLQTTTRAATTTSQEPDREYPCIIHANPGTDPYCACETTVSGKSYFASTSLISSSCADYTTFPTAFLTNEPPKPTENPKVEPITKTEDGKVMSYPDRTIRVGNYPGGRYTYTDGVGEPVTLSTPLPTQTDANNKGSSQCGSIDDACDRAMNDGFEDDTVYKDYVSRFARIQSGMVMVATFGQAGCTAQFTCDDYGLGMKGKDIKDA